MGLSIHAAYDGTGNTALTAMTTAAGSEIASVTSAGIIPLAKGVVPNLFAWGAVCVSTADGIKELKMQNPDQWDPTNGNDWKPGGTSVAPLVSPFFHDFLPSTAGRLLSYSQKAAGTIIGYEIDYHAGVGNTCYATNLYTATRRVGPYTITAGGALTAGTWGTTVWTPTILPTKGKYALLGFGLSAATAGALVRFQHPDFSGLRPGLPAVDFYTTATTVSGQVSGDQVFNGWRGKQFVELGLRTGLPLVPVFTVSDSATNLAVDFLDNTADTPAVDIYLAYLGP